MLTDTIIEDEAWDAVDLEGLAEAAATAALQHLGMETEGYEIAVLGCDDAKIAELNADFRDKPTPTNVLSWPAWELGAEDDGGDPDLPPEPDTMMPEHLGDIAIAFGVCKKEAEAAENVLEHHVTHLLVHGVLHLLGYDHIRDADATLMEGLETSILGKMGIADPYS